MGPKKKSHGSEDGLGTPPPHQGSSPQSTDGAYVPGADGVSRRDSGGSSSSRPGSGRVHRPSVAQMVMNRDDRKSRRMTASLGSMFVFDTCKPSDLRSAMEEMEADDGAPASGVGDEENPFSSPFDDGPPSASPFDDGSSTFSFNTFANPLPNTPNNTASDNMSNGQIHDMLAGGHNHAATGSMPFSSSSTPPPSGRLPPVPTPLSVQTTSLYGNPSMSSPTRSPGSPHLGSQSGGFMTGGSLGGSSATGPFGGPSSPSSSPSAFTSSPQPVSSGGFFSPPSQTPPPMSGAVVGDEFEYYSAEQQLDALIDFLDVGAEMLVEDDQGLTDWLRDDNFSQFEFNPEWLELTLTMKPKDENASTNTRSSMDGSDPSDPFSKPLAGITISSPSPSPSSPSPSLTSSNNNIGTRRATVALPTPPSPLDLSNNHASTGASSLGTAPVSMLAQVASQDRPRPPSVPDTIPVQGAPSNDFSSPFSHIPTTNSSPMVGTPLPLVGGGGPPMPLSPFLLPTAIAQQGASRSGKPLLRSASKQESSSEATARANKSGRPNQKDKLFGSPLISPPGMGETAITVSASIFRVLRMMDPERPFESVMHDSGALAPADLSITLSPSIPIPPSAGSNQQSPPSFTVQVAVIAPFWEGLQCLAGLSQGKSTNDILDSLPSTATSTSSFASPLTGAPIISSRTKPNAAPSSGNGASQKNASLSSSSGSSAALNKKNCLTYSEWKGYPSRGTSDVQGVPHALISTIAIVNDQGRTKRIIKLVALAMSPADTLPNIPLGTSQLRRPTDPVGGLDPILGLDPHSASILSAISSAHGTIFVMPPSSASASEALAAPVMPSAETLSPLDIEDFQLRLKLYQKLNYHAGPIKGNPHVRLMMVNGMDATLARLTLGNNSGSSASSPLDASQQQIAFILDSALKWAQQQGISVMQTKSESKWLQKIGALPFPSPSSLTPSSWFPHPLLSHLAAQTHALRMEALMTSFDHIQKVKAQTGLSSSKSPSGGPKPSSAKTPLPSQTSPFGRMNTSGSSPDLARMTVAGTADNSKVSPQNSPSSKRASAMGPSSGLPSSQNKPLVNKRIIAVIGLTRSGRTSVIRRACHARYSRINAAGGGGFDPSSTFMMSTLSPMTSTFGATTLNGGSGAAASASSFADVFFNTQRCRIEFVETPSRSSDKIQFYKDINRAHAFIFVYAGVHPSPAEIAEMHQSMSDIWQAKRQQPLSASGNGSSSSALSRLNALQPGSTSTSSSSVFASSMMRRPSTVNNIPIVILGTQAPQNLPSSLHALHSAIPNTGDDDDSNQPIASDPSMMSLTQLLARYNALAHFAVDTAPVQDPALAKALQWLYNRIGEETLSLKGVRATNRPHHSGSVSGARAPRPIPSAMGQGGYGANNSITSIGGFNSGGVTPPSGITPGNSRKVLLPSSSPNSGRISTIVGNTSGVSVPTADTKGGAFKSAMGGFSSSSPSSKPGAPGNASSGAISASSGGFNSSGGGGSSGGGNSASNSSVAVFMKVEALVVKMRTGVPAANASARPHPSLNICDRRLENGAWIAIPGSTVGGNMGNGGNGNGSGGNGSGNSGGNGGFSSLPQTISPASSSPSLMSGSPSNVEDSSSSSKKKQKILQKCFVGNDAIDWVTNAIVKPEKASAGFGGASGSYLPSPSQLRSEAIAHLQQLLDLSVIRCIWSGGIEETSFSSQSKFKDSHDAIYRFQMDEDNESVLNMRKVWIGEVDHSEIEQLATWLYQKVQPLIVALSSLTMDSSGGYSGNSAAGGSHPRGGSGGSSSGLSTFNPSTNGANGASLASGGSSSSLLSSGTSDDFESNSGVSSPSLSHSTSGSSSGPRTFVIDGEAFKRSAHFGDLLLFSAKLQRIKVDRLTRPQKIAFWINVYNILSIHAAIQHGYVGKSKSKRKWLYLKTFYQIDGALFSLDDILHGILRGNRKNPNTGKVPFKPNDPRRKLALHDDSTSILSSQVYSNSLGGSALPTASMGSSGRLPPFDPRILFTLTSLSRNSPFISPMRADALDSQLNALATAYLDSQLELDFKRSSLSLPSSILTFRADFSNKAPAPFLTFLATFLEAEKAKNVNFLANKIKEKDIKTRSDDPTPSAPRFR